MLVAIFRNQKRPFIYELQVRKSGETVRQFSPRNFHKKSKEEAVLKAVRRKEERWKEKESSWSP